MYRLGHQKRHRYWPYILIGSIGLVCLIGGGILITHSLRANTSLTQSKPVTQHISAGNTTVQRIVKQAFFLNIPAGWQATPGPQTEISAYSWAGASPDGAGRRLDIYIDHIPDALAVNRLLPVRVADDKLATVGTVSDNCVSFTDKAAESATANTALTKWDGVNFICDMGNYERDVVAIGSSAGVNNVTLQGKTTGTHRVLIVYTDNSINPDFTALSSIVQSFQLQ